MGIRAGLKKNTKEIRNKIRELGIECTTSNWGDLVYLESEQCVTWGDANGFGIYNCGDNEDFFFYLITLHTLNDREIENLKEKKIDIVNHLKNFVRAIINYKRNI